jgi:hypothetical protein
MVASKMSALAATARDCAVEAEALAGAALVLDGRMEEDEATFSCRQGRGRGRRRAWLTMVKGVR